MPRSRLSRTRQIAALTATLVLIPVLVSLVGALAEPSNSTVGIRAVEWLRDNGARGLVNQVESTYYSLSAPAKGGQALRALPTQSGLAAVSSPSPKRVRLYRPPSIRPPISPALPGEGKWRATFAGGAGNPPVLISSFRPDPDYPQSVAGVAWINHTRTSVSLIPGRAEPAVSLPSRGATEVPQNRRQRLVATFNSAFKLADSGGGFAQAGHTYAPLHDGVATIVKYASGRVDVVSWQRGQDAGPGVVFARQDLPLIVNHGRANPNLADGPEWGATLGNAIRVWRSGVGVDRHGNLIYAAADQQTVGSLAAILRRAGAVRAMELDINAFWPSFITYRMPGAGDAANLLPSMQRSPQRYLSPEDRDFFAVYLR